MAGGQDRAWQKADEAVWYLMGGYGLLANLVRGEMRINQREAEGLLSLEGETSSDGEISSDGETSCKVCRSEQREAIDKAIKEGRTLRDIEAEFGVSKATLSRHKNNCLNLGAVRLHE